MSEDAWADCWLALLHTCTDGAEKAITVPDFSLDGWQPGPPADGTWDVVCDVCGYAWTWKDMTWTVMST